MTSEIPIDELVELTNFQESPRFPHHIVLDSDILDDVVITPTSAITPTSPVYLEQDDNETVTSSSGKSGSDGKGKSKRRLKFHGEKLDLRPWSTTPTPDGDVTSPNPRTPKSSSSKSSGSPVTLIRSGTPIKQKSKEPEVKMKTKGGHYSVAARDASLIERIAHKVPKRSTRVLQPHEIFIELEELRSSSFQKLEDLEWEETARWIKFEEDVEQEAGRWGRPHVSALAFHSLVELRKGLEKGLVLLDVDGDNFPAIVDKVVGQLVQSGQLPHEKVDFMLQALYRRHKHQHKVTILDDLKHAAKSADGTLHHIGDQLRHRYHSSPRMSDLNLKDQEIDKKQNEKQDEYKKENLTAVTFAVGGSNNSIDHISISELPPLSDKELEAQEDEYNPVKPTLNHAHPSSASMLSQVEDHHKLSHSMQDLLQKIPDDAESLTVLVGGVTFLQEPIVAFVRLKQSHLLGDLTEVPIPVRFIYLTLGPCDLMDYHEVGRAMATLMSDKCFHDMAYSALEREELLDAMEQFLDDSIVLPPGDWDQDLLLPLMHERNEQKRKKERKQEEIDFRQQQGDDDPMRFTYRPFKGIYNDIKRLIKRYPSDFKDVLHLQTLFAIFFVYISCIAPAIAFGGLMEEVTLNLIGETETLIGTGLCGVVFGLFSVQPLAILAFTGPLLLFEEIIIEFAHMLHIEYISWRACIGLWLMLFVIIFALSEASFLVKYFTRFSEEVFTGVITLFFTVEAIRTIVKIFQRNPLCGIEYPCGMFAHCTNTCICPLMNMTNMTYDDMGSGMIHFLEMDNGTEPRLPTGFVVCNQVNTALWSMLLCVGTFCIAVILRKFRQSRFLGKQGRRLVSDFGMLTAIATMVSISYYFRNTITVETLEVPAGYKPSNSSERGWIINPLDNLQYYHVIGAIIPAFLLGTLIFIENQLTLLLVNKHEHKLRKGVGYHFDLVIVGCLAGVCGIMGLPWHCAASVRSVQHLQALSIFSRRNAPGEKPKLEGIYEQRVTNIAVHFLILLSPLAYPILREIPFAVIIGVFFYLAYASFSGIQLRKRLKLLFTPPKHHPDIHYVRKVRTWKMNLYTIIQFVLVCLFFGLKLSPAGMVYPLAIVLLIPLRSVLSRFIFNHVEMEALDSEEDFPDDENDETDFTEYEQTHEPY